MGKNISGFSFVAAISEGIEARYKLLEKEHKSEALPRFDRSPLMD